MRSPSATGLRAAESVRSGAGLQRDVVGPPHRGDRPRPRSRDRRGPARARHPEPRGPRRSRSPARRPAVLRWAGRARPSAIGRPTRVRPARWAATRNISSVISRVSATIAPSPTPGKTKTLFAWPITRVPPGPTTSRLGPAGSDEGPAVGPGQDVLGRRLGAGARVRQRQDDRHCGRGAPPPGRAASEKAPATGRRADEHRRPRWRGRRRLGRRTPTVAARRPGAGPDRRRTAADRPAMPGDRCEPGHGCRA